MTKEKKMLNIFKVIHYIEKKSWFFILFLSFGIVPSFGQNHFLWTTGTNQQGSNIRSITFSAARTEILRLFDQWNYTYFTWDEEIHYSSRSVYKERMLRGYDRSQKANDQDQLIYYSWVKHWLDNDRNFVFARISGSGRFRGVLVSIIVGDEVISMSFDDSNWTGNGFTTNANNRRILEGILSDYIK